MHEGEDILVAMAREWVTEKGIGEYAAADRYVAFYFDDTYMLFEDIARTRDAARRYLDSSLTHADRVGLYTSSGQGNVEFTSDRGKLEEGPT